MSVFVKSQNETISGTYLKRYCFLACIFCATCIIGLTLIGVFAFNTKTWSYGVAVLLFLSLVLAVMAVVALVALYREIGRYHERKFPIEVQGRIKELESEVERLEKENPQSHEENDAKTELQASRKNETKRCCRLFKSVRKSGVEDDMFTKMEKDISYILEEKVKSEIEEIKKKYEKDLANLKNVAVNKIQEINLSQAKVCQNPEEGGCTSSVESVTEPL